MWARATLLWGFLALSSAVCLAGRAVAELMTAWFPDGVPGYDNQDGVTVETRLHPEQMPLGVREGGLVFTPRIDQGVGYTSNLLPGPHGRGSWQVVTNPVLGIASGWSRDAFGAMFSIQDTSYSSLPGQHRTDGTASVGGRVDIGDDSFALAAAHVLGHEDRGQIDTVPADRPIAFQIDDVRASYQVNAGRWRIIPSIDVANWTYAGTTILGLPASQSYRDRIVVQPGITLRYEVAPLREMLFVARAIGLDYTAAPAGQPTLDSVRYQFLAGFDDDSDPVWRWRVLAGAEARMFASPLYPQQNTLIAEAGVGWSPSGITTLRATISRESADAAQEGVSGLVYSAARLTIDHEYLRDLILRASAGLQRADFFQGGHQTGTVLGLGVTWVVSRNARLSFTFDQSDIRGSRLATEALATGYSRGVGLMTLRLGL